jgi:protoporphyrinogen oxidase
VRRVPRAIPVFAPGHRGRMARAAAELSSLGNRLLGSHAVGVGLEACAAAGAPVPGDLPDGARHVA